MERVNKQKMDADGKNTGASCLLRAVGHRRPTAPVIFEKTTYKG